MRLPELLVFLSLLSFIGSCDFEQKTSMRTSSEFPEFDQFFQSIENFSGNIMVAVEGQTVYSRCIGYANRELLAKNTLDTRFRIGSISKPITALAVMILQERGIIHTEERLSTYLSDLPSSWQDITIHQLLTHTSGLGHLTDFRETRELLRHPVAIEDAFERFKSVPLVNNSGDTFYYSGMGYVVLTILVEAVTDRSFEVFVEDEIFKKLGMTHSEGDDPTKLIMNRASGYEVSSEGRVRNADFQYMPSKRGAGNMISTVEDLLRLEQAFSTNTLLSEETVNKIITPHTTYLEGGYEGMYGYGLDIVKNDTINSIFHTGAAPGFQALFYMFPDKGIVVAACANVRLQRSNWRADFASLVYRKLTSPDYDKVEGDH